MSGTLWAVGVGPGDPELLTLKAARLLREATAVACFSGPGRTSNALTIAREHVVAPVVTFEYPVTTGTTDHPGGYDGVMTEFYDAAATRLRALLAEGDVVLLAEGDPLFYSTNMYLLDRLADLDCRVVPGVTSVQGATSAAATALCRHEDVVTILPGTLPEEELAWRLATSDAAVVMKLGRTFPKVRAALASAGLLERAVYVERATWGEQRVLPAGEVDPTAVPYFSLVVVPGVDRRADDAGRHAAAPVDPVPSGAALVHVVGLGPGPTKWLSPEATEVLARVDAVYGYAPYVRRVPARQGLELHPSGNTVEVERAREALDAALQGRRVAIVSGGDAGVFAMAAATFEAAEDERYRDVEIRVVPGITAAQAAAALAGAPLGGDFACVSLSDRLKPWDVVADRLRYLSRADMAVAIYNPRSHARPGQLHEAKRVLLEERDPSTVVVLARDVGRVEESLTVTTLIDLDPEVVDMKTLVIIGSSLTRRTSRTRVWTPRFVD
ncbi:MAG: precorrin-3B C(17)-methyltransferase [Arachnia propionica]|uniref:precorrin-3B C(17)-methyltransferase n=1 Tax=Arachnia propionica TaxID=1750 RepID=UPI00270B63E7|nr:precorrin-3B C(17)-methyltransferase [Arachnia propionica]